MTNTLLRFADGSSRSVPFDIAPDVVGLDWDGDVLLPFLDGYVPLTPCCFADGKGSQVGVVCRSCYRVVPVKHGMTTREITVPVSR